MVSVRWWIYVILLIVIMEYVWMGSVVVWMDMRGYFVNIVWMSVRLVFVKMEGYVWMDIKIIVVNVFLDLLVCIVFYGFDF